VQQVPEHEGNRTVVSVTTRLGPYLKVVCKHTIKSTCHIGSQHAWSCETLPSSLSCHVHCKEGDKTWRPYNTILPMADSMQAEWQSMTKEVPYITWTSTCLTKEEATIALSSSSSVYWHSNLVTFSDWLRMLAHIDTGNRKFDARGNRTHNLAVWSRTGYQCDNTSKLTS
jgi:hypothetical protein